MSRLSPFVFALSFIAAVAAAPAEAAQRAFVSSSGMDSNAASGCGLSAPCRSFATAMTVVNDGGEIVALDGAGYGAITITKNVTITANPGFYAGIAVPAGNDGVTIATAGVNVILRGLNIHSTGGNNGVVMTNGATLSIENCVISNFATDGVHVDTMATVRIVDSLIRDNGNTGIHVQGGSGTSISGTRVLGNANVGIWVNGDPAGTTTMAAVSDSIIDTNPNLSLYSYAPTATAIAKLSVTRSTMSNNAYGPAVVGGSGTAVLTFSNSMVTGNGVGLYQTGGTGTLESLGNNTVRQNGPNTGALTTVSPM
jgi:Right handed beta helix region